MSEKKKETKNQDMIEKEMKEKMKQTVEDEKIPGSLEPEAVEKMLETRKKKKSNNRRWKYASVAAAACVCLVVGAVGYTNMNAGKNERPGTVTEGRSEEDQGKIALAKNYDEIKKYLKENEKRAKGQNGFGRADAAYLPDGAMAASSVAESTKDMAGADYSDTNIRQEGVGEADTVKTDGKNLYILNDQTVEIVDVSQAEMKDLASIEIDENCFIREVFVSDGRLVILYTESKCEEGKKAEDGIYKDYTCAAVYDVTDPANPREAGVISQSGQYHTMRVKDGYVYLVSDFYTYYDSSVSNESDYIPQIQGSLLRAEDIYMPQGTTGSQHTVISAFALSDPTEKLQTKAIFGNAGMCYVSENNIYITSNYYEDSDVSRTLIRKISYTDGKLAGVAQTKIKGMLNDSFSIDEYEGNLRLVTTIDEIYSNNDIMPLNETADETADKNGTTDKSDASKVTEKAVEENVKDAVPGTNSLYVLNDKLEIIGSIHNLAKDETIYSARFMGDTGYFVTYRQVDPLFSVDLSDPENPKILGELKIPGFSEYLHPYGDGKLLGIGIDVSEDGFTTEGVKLSMFNVTDPSNVTEENKYTIEESYGTDVGYNYKGVFVDVQKNLFGFVTYHDGVTYQLYTYDEAEGFKEVMSRQLSGYEGSRGLYIGDVFYLVSGNMIESYSMNGFEKMDDIVL